jgi:hypothetical protein
MIHDTEYRIQRRKYTIQIEMLILFPGNDCIVEGCRIGAFYRES